MEARADDGAMRLLSAHPCNPFTFRIEDSPMRITHAIWVASLASGVALLAASTVADSADSRRAPSLDAIKALTGTWVAADEAGQPTSQVMSEFRVTSGGHAVIETLFPGTEHEMISMYHMDGGDLVMTHYCTLGNRPHMKAEIDPTDGHIVFRCVSGGAIQCDKEMHMHEGHLRILAADRMNNSWHAMQDGKPVHEAKFNVVRRKP